MTAQAAPLLGDVVLLTAMTEDYREGGLGERDVREALLADLEECLEARGYAAEILKNYWPSSDNYQGINDSYAVPCAASPSGKLLFELQFHTPESFAFKSDSHVLYETFRAARDPDAKLILERAKVTRARVTTVRVRLLS